MASEQRLPPSAASLTASMRDLGYSLETAIADLIDNSIFALASSIEIICDLSPHEPFLVIIDNGCGMSQEEVLEAMRHGATNPSNERDPLDLGRFGLGLKTASFSQCRSLTVISRKDGEVCGAEWDLDLIDEKDDWVISIPDETEISLKPFTDRLTGNGTIVLWSNLDRLFEEKQGSTRDEIVNEKLDIVERHLSLVFHRFLEGSLKDRGKLSITLNGHPVSPFDPFCIKNKATQKMPEEVVRIDGSTVRLQPYILPHHSRLTAAEYDFYQDRSDFISNQGAYIYRNGRLLTWGDWFRIIPKGEATKLARVQIDFPNCLDEAWTIDIRKSRARPPHAVRERIKQIISHVTGRSTNVHRGRGKKLFTEHQAPVWERYADQSKIRYALNTKHPLIEKLSYNLNEEQADLLVLLLESISSSLPVEMIYSDYSTSPREVSQADIDSDQAYDKLKLLSKALFSSGEFNSETFREIINSTRQFTTHQDLVDKFIKENMK